MSEKQPEKKVGFFAKAKRSSKASLNELKKVHWPTKKELITYTNVVLVTVVVIAALIWIVDSVVGKVFGLLIFTLSFFFSSTSSVGTMIRKI